jgi:hypothetical protein
MTTYSVTLEKSVSINAESVTQPSPVSVFIEIIDTGGFFDHGIFTYIIDTVTNLPVYNRVAVPSDIQNYYFDVVGDKQYVRKDSVTRVFDTGAEAEEFIDEVEGLILTLCIDMDVLEQLGTPVSVTISS